MLFDLLRERAMLLGRRAGGRPPGALSAHGRALRADGRALRARPSGAPGSLIFDGRDLLFSLVCQPTTCEPDVYR